MAKLVIAELEDVLMKDFFVNEEEQSPVEKVNSQRKRKGSETRKEASRKNREATGRRDSTLYGADVSSFAIVLIYGSMVSYGIRDKLLCYCSSL